MKFEFVRQPVFLILLSLIAGILTSYYLFSAVTWYWLFPILLSILLAVISAKSKTFKSQRNFIRPLCLILLFFGIGILTMSLSKPASLNIEEKTEFNLNGRIEDVASKTSGDRLLIDISEMKDSRGRTFSNPGKAYITTEPGNWRPGDLVRMNVELSEIGNNRNYRQSNINYLKFKKIFYTGYIDGNKIHITGYKPSLSDKARQNRNRIESFIENTGLEANTKNFINSLLLGDKEAIDKTDKEMFKEAGISHVLAVSGLHVGLIAAIVIFMLFPLTAVMNYKSKYLIALPIIWLYVWLTGMSPSTVRAAVMISFYFIALLLERKHDTMRALGWAAFLILLIDPYSLFQVGFQLSFVSVFFLLLLVKELNFVDQQQSPKLHKLTATVLVTLVATLATWSLIAYYFGTVMTFTLPANLILVPFLPIFVGGVLIYLAGALCGIDIIPLRMTLDYSYRKALSFMEQVSGIGNFEDMSIGWTTVALWLLGLTFAGLLLRYGIKRRAHWIAASLILIAAITTVGLFMKEPQKDGFIIQKSYPDIKLMDYNGEEEQEVKMPKYEISMLEVHGKKILVVDREDFSIANPSDELEKFIKEVDYVIIGSGSKGKISNLLKGIPKGRACFVLHPSLRKKRENQLIQEIQSAGHNIHSLRHSGPIHCFP